LREFNISKHVKVWVSESVPVWALQLSGHLDFNVTLSTKSFRLIGVQLLSYINPDIILKDLKEQ